MVLWTTVANCDYFFHLHNLFSPLELVFLSLVFSFPLHPRAFHTYHFTCFHDLLHLLKRQADALGSLWISWFWKKSLLEPPDLLRSRQTTLSLHTAVAPGSSHGLLGDSLYSPLSIESCFLSLSSSLTPSVAVEIQSQADWFIVPYLFSSLSTWCVCFPPVYCALSIWKLKSWEVFWSYLSCSSLFTPFGSLLNLFKSWTLLWSFNFYMFSLLIFTCLFSTFLEDFNFTLHYSFEVFCLLVFNFQRLLFFSPCPVLLSCNWHKHCVSLRCTAWCVMYVYIAYCLLWRVNIHHHTQWQTFSCDENF